jgi:hypothetical protein
MPSRSPGKRWALTSPFHPYLGIQKICQGGIFSVALAVSKSSPTCCLPVRKYGTLCCPDFPLRYLKPQRQDSLILSSDHKANKYFLSISSQYTIKSKKKNGSCTDYCTNFRSNSLKSFYFQIDFSTRKYNRIKMFRSQVNFIG